MSGKSKLDALESKRRLALLMHRLGYAETVIAQRLQVEPETVSGWLYCEGGRNSWKH